VTLAHESATIMNAASRGRRITASDRLRVMTPPLLTAVVDGCLR
jgi:hypothetical protein